MRRRLQRASERVGFALSYRLADLTHALGIATPKRTVAGRYWSCEPMNGHGGDPGLAALAALPGDATVFDVGAHVGEYAVPLAVDTDRRVIAFEPNEESAGRLARTVERNDVGDRIGIRQIGVGNADVEQPFYRSTYSKLSAFDREGATRWGADVAAVETVPVRRLDSLVDAGLSIPEGIKIDVEGAEMAVLEGAERTIACHSPQVVLEVHEGTNRSAIEAWLDDREYSVVRIDDTLVCSTGERTEGGRSTDDPSASRQ